jgi:hypothetical protein
MSQINNNSNQEQAKKSVAKLELGNLEFPKLLETAIADTDTFAQLINNVFSPALPQFYGSKIEVVQNRRVMTTIYFTDDGQHTDVEMGYDEENGPFKAITPILTSDNNKSAISRMKAYNFIHNNGTRPKQFKLTEEGKSILSEFVPSQAINQKNGKINWDSITAEQAIPDGFGRSITAFAVTIDFTKLVRRIYADDKHTKYSYLIQIGNPVVNNLMTAGGYNINQNWIMFIYRVDADDVQALIRKFGFGTANNLGIVVCN